MSGIVGILSLNGAPIAPPLLQAMVEALAYRGPDAQSCWSQSRIGLGHTLLRTTPEAAEQYPLTLDGQVWMVADARIDGRSDLIRRLQAAGQQVPAGVPDGELILRAYQVWQQDCLSYLLGDFAFAIWDQPRQRLFCARDHFGVKPFYYACSQEWLIVSNTLNCIRVHPAVSSTFYEPAIADFLLSGTLQDPATTIFADIRRLPAAHGLTWSEGQLTVQPYWTLPREGYLRYRHPMDYVEQFRELLEQAVSDRLRTDRVGLLMSGGLDSSSIAAVAKQMLSQQSAEFDLRAYTAVYDQLIPDQERYYASLVAAALQIPIQYQVGEAYPLFHRWDQPELFQPEPLLSPTLALTIDQYRQVAAHSRVALSGHGGDPVFFPSGTYFLDQLRAGQIGSLVTEIGQYVTLMGRFPPLGIRTQLRRWLGPAGEPAFPYPDWLHPDFEARLQLRERWRSLVTPATGEKSIRADAYRLLTEVSWSFLFESFDPDRTGVPLEVRHPYFDLRLMEYLLSIPPIPWFIHKALLRIAMGELLPETICKRPKTHLAGDPIAVMLERSIGQNLPSLELPAILAEYLDRDRLPRVTVGGKSIGHWWVDLRPLSLTQWIVQQRSVQPRSGYTGRIGSFSDQMLEH
ncbi:hypothetical protein BST81_10100 [Leptolyngbya sp. 'hensonii']|uniref:asparagine synthase-related protein n=1 Tax=Leptolyngbya sp. 'hensonii' TaxID=1922337 RepID=UPI0009502382|nr:asparagine synthase-related protein [Leptolyngbya sp. 'hensonii']OLP18627.1 hypothetical protein BST81_10100 [Leptolyngbya sp. 'hensonii']